ncbi:phosphoglycerate mutase GpmB [subsurface metagenome]
MVEYFKTLSGRLNVYFLRHGESEGNNARIIQGRHDLPLSERGLQQAESIADWLADKHIEVVLSSPLKRATQTAEVVGRVLGLKDVHLHDGLNELDTGIFTGLTVPQIEKRFPEAWRSFQRSSWEGVPEAERISELCNRAEDLWRDLGRLFAAGQSNLLCVTHSGILQWIVKVTMAQRSWMPLVPMANCSISQFSLDNQVEAERPRYYFEWTHLNYQPVAGKEVNGNLFLDRSTGIEGGNQ